MDIVEDVYEQEKLAKQAYEDWLDLQEYNNDIEEDWPTLLDKQDCW